MVNDLSPLILDMLTCFLPCASLLRLKDVLDASFIGIDPLAPGVTRLSKVTRQVVTGTHSRQDYS